MLPIISLLSSAGTALKNAGLAGLAGGKIAGLQGASKLQSLIPKRLIGQSMNVGPTQPSLVNKENALRLGKYLYNQNQSNLQRQPNQMQMQRPNLRNIIDMYG